MRPGEDDLGAYCASKRTDGGRVTMGCLAFLREHKVADGRFPADVEDGTLVFEVGEPGGRFLRD